MSKLRPSEVDQYQKLAAQEENHAMGRFVMAGGGMGSKADMRFAEMIQDEPLGFPLKRARFDTCDREPTTATDIQLSLTAENVCEIKANPSLFGEPIVQAVEALGGRLHPAQVGNGARTTRAVCQCHLSYHRRRVLQEMRLIINDLYEQGCKSIKPILVGSCGGGTNAAFAPLMCQWLSHDSSFRSELLVGLSPHYLLDPIVVACFPLNYVRSGSPTERQEVCIQSNIYAWELELDQLYRGSMLDQAYLVSYHCSEDRTTQAMADALYDVVLHQPYFKSRDVDKLAGPHDARYFGRDGL